MTLRLEAWPGHVLAIIAGCLVTLSLAPFNAWPLGILSLAALLYLLDHCTARQAALRGWCYGLGLFGSGSSWVYVSIHVYGYAPAPLALLLTLLFCAGLAIFTLLTAYCYVRWVKALALGRTLGFAAIIVVGDWFRSWFLTGFPWLYTGYAHLESPLSGWAPVWGIFGLNFIVALTAAVLLWLGRSRSRQSAYASLAVLLIWLSGPLIAHIDWTHPDEQAPVKVAMVQANIPQELKWDPDFFQPSLQRYEQMSQPLWQQADLIIWPEAAVPAIYQNAKTFVDRMAAQAEAGDSSFILGLPYQAQTQAGPVFHNSLLALGRGEGLYHKQRLVPFGEYVPLEQWLRGLIQFFDLPMSNFQPGPAAQAAITAGGVSIAPFICYEIVYPDLVRRSRADLLLTLSNDAWFGSSIGPLQHLQMAQMRALEMGRYLLRSTGSGISAIIDHRGQISLQGGQFTQEVLQGEARVMTGLTPFGLWGNWPVLLLCLLIGISQPLFAAKCAAKSWLRQPLYSLFWISNS